MMMTICSFSLSLPGDLCTSPVVYYDTKNTKCFQDILLLSICTFLRIGNRPSISEFVQKIYTKLKKVSFFYSKKYFYVVYCIYE